MRKRVLLAAICLVALPVFFSTSSGDRNAVPLPTVAMAGHTMSGGLYCPCDPVDGICQCCQEINRISAPPPESDEVLTKDDDSSIDFDSGTLIIALGLLAWRLANPWF